MSLICKYSLFHSIPTVEGAPASARVVHKNRWKKKKRFTTLGRKLEKEKSKLGAEKCQVDHSWGFGVTSLTQNFPKMHIFMVFAKSEFDKVITSQNPIYRLPLV